MPIPGVVTKTSAVQSVSVVCVGCATARIVAEFREVAFDSTSSLNALCADAVDSLYSYSAEECVKGTTKVPSVICVK